MKYHNLSICFRDRFKKCRFPALYPLIRIEFLEMKHSMSASRGCHCRRHNACGGARVFKISLRSFPFPNYFENLCPFERWYAFICKWALKMYRITWISHYFVSKQFSLQFAVRFSRFEFSVISRFVAGSWKRRKEWSGPALFFEFTCGDKKFRSRKRDLMPRSVLNFDSTIYERHFLRSRCHRRGLCDFVHAIRNIILCVFSLQRSRPKYGMPEEIVKCGIKITRKQ